MTTADYILAAIGILLSLGGCGIAWMVSMVSYFSPTPGPAEAAKSRKGCLGLIAALVLLIYFIGVIISGSWGWQ